MNPPFISIIVPVYNVEKYLRECVDSIIKQSSDDWELILIDDGSPDSCPQICDEYAANDNRIKVIHQQNRGVAAARNAGLDVAKGEWIWFVDSDDVVDMRHIVQIKVWLGEHKEIDLVMFDLDTFKDGSAVSSLNDVFAVNDERLSKNEFLMKYICYHHQRLWYHRSGWQNDCRQCFKHHVPIRFSHGIRVAEDLDFQYKFLMFCRHPVKFDVLLYHYRLRDGSATKDATYRIKVVEDLPVVLDCLVRWIKDGFVQPEPWLDFRIMKMLQNLLYSASQVKGLDRVGFQAKVRKIVNRLEAIGFPCTHNPKILLANRSVNLYFLLNKVYLRLKGLR